jgi:hypothetical protein
MPLLSGKGYSSYLCQPLWHALELCIDDQVSSNILYMLLDTGSTRGSSSRGRSLQHDIRLESRKLASVLYPQD